MCVLWFSYSGLFRYIYNIVNSCVYCFTSVSNKVEKVILGFEK